MTPDRLNVAPIALFTKMLGHRPLRQQIGDADDGTVIDQRPEVACLEQDLTAAEA